MTTIASTTPIYLVESTIYHGSIVDRHYVINDTCVDNDGLLSTLVEHDYRRILDECNAISTDNGWTTMRIDGWTMVRSPILLLPERDMCIGVSAYLEHDGQDLDDSQHFITLRTAISHYLKRKYAL